MALTGLLETPIICLSSVDCSGQTCLAWRKERKVLLDFECIEFCSEQRSESLKLSERKKEENFAICIRQDLDFHHKPGLEPRALYH
jgi:hypothetical protein